jgi:ribonucleoside-diphosphate reductase alpha chain
VPSRLGRNDIWDNDKAARSARPPSPAEIADGEHTNKQVAAPGANDSTGESSGMSTVRLEAVATDEQDIPMQPASRHLGQEVPQDQAGRGAMPTSTAPTSAWPRPWPKPSPPPSWYERFLWALRRGAIPAGRITSNAGAQEHKPATSTINCTVSGTITDSMDDILEKVHEAGLTLKAGCGIGYEFSHAAPARRVRLRRRRVHLRPDVVHGYLRQDVLHRELGRWPPRRADGHLRRRPSGREGLHPRQARRRPPAPVQPVAADHRRLHGGGQERRDWPLVFPVAPRKPTTIDLADAEQVVWRDWPTHQGYITRDDGLVACKIYGQIRRATCGT